MSATPLKITIQTIGSDFQNIPAKELETYTAKTKQEANKIKRTLIKKYNLEKHHYYLINHSKNLELKTNY